MKKIIGFILAIIMFAGVLVYYEKALDKQLQEKVSGMKLGNMYTCLEAEPVMRGALEKDTLLVLGSSEFYPSWEIGLDSFPTLLFNSGGYDFDVAIAGKGGTQCLNHAITVAAYGDYIENKKLALILSPQWFTPQGVTEKAFAGVFLPEVYLRWAKNNTLSQETASKIQERTLELLKNSNPDEAQRVINTSIKDGSNDNIQQGKKRDFNYPRRVATWGENIFSNLKKKRECNEKFKDEVASVRTNDASEINFSELLKQAEAEGEKQCTNNPYGIYNSYYTTYVAGALSKSEGSASGDGYGNSKEYDDLKLFLQVCKEKNIEPMLVILPVHGQWYDYTGFKKSERERYYQNIRDIAVENQVKVADFSDKEYEKYFLADIMHVGWKGWVYLNESFYKFYKEK